MASPATRWALAHPHEWALVHGSPVPGYAAPADTVASALRLTTAMASVVSTAYAAGELEPPRRPLPGPRVTTPVVLEVLGGPAPEAPYEDLLERALLLMVGLVGAVSDELFGHLVGALTDVAAWFDRAVAVTAEGVGLVVPLPRTVGG